MCFSISYEFSTGVSKNSVYGHRRHILLRPDHTRTFNTNNNWLVVWNMLYFSIQLGMSSSQLTFIFFRGVETTNQIRMMIITIKTYNSDGNYNDYNDNNDSNVIAMIIMMLMMIVVISDNDDNENNSSNEHNDNADNSDLSSQQFSNQLIVIYIYIW